jgi:hypothetical protein
VGVGVLGGGVGEAAIKVNVGTTAVMVSADWVPATLRATAVCRMGFSSGGSGVGVLQDVMGKEITKNRKKSRSHFFFIVILIPVLSIILIQKN